MSTTTDPRADRPPRFCPTCGEDLSEHPYYQRAAGPAGRLLRKIALFLLPVMAAAYLALLFWGNMPLGFGTGHGYWAVAFIGAPSLLLYLLSGLLPRVRRVICLRCSWSADYALERGVRGVS